MPPPAQSACPEAEAIAQRASSTSAEQAAALLRQHVQGCPVCRDKVAEVVTSAVTLSSAASGSDGTPTGRGPAPLLPGAQLQRYMVLEPLGEGGMGVVYAAYDSQLHRKVALKLLHPDKEWSSEGARRLLREAQALAKLSHPNVVAVHDVGQHEGNVFVAMEFLEGHTLDEWVAKEKPSWREILRAFREAGRGLAAAHAAGMAHRDFKPSNVHLAKDGRVRVMDFGVARATTGSGAEPAFTGPASNVPDEAESFHTPLTRAGALVGTLPYLAPELFAGSPADEASDEFSFCVSLYEMLFGQRPFPNVSRHAPARWKLLPLPAGHRVPAWVVRAVLRGLSLDPRLRHGSVRAAVEALGRDPSVVRRRVAVGLGVLAGAAVGVALIASTVSARRALCAAEAEQLRGVWDEDTRHALGDAFRATNEPSAAATWGRARAVLDGYARAWVKTRTAVCRASRIEGSQSDEVLGLRMECLDRRKQSFAALLKVFASADAKLVPRAIDAAMNLPPLDGCANLEALRSPVRPPEEPRLRERVEQVRARLAEGRARELAGQYPAALEVARAAAAEAQALHYRPLEAEALYLQGRCQVLVRPGPEARELLQRAAFAAQAGKHHEVAAMAGAQLVWFCAEQGDRDCISNWEQSARAELEALGGDDEIEAHLLGASAKAASEQGRVEDSLELNLRALALRQRSSGGDLAKQGMAENNVAADLKALARYRDAVEHYRKAISAMENTYGPTYPKLMFPLMGLGGAMVLSAGPSDEARKHLEAALTVCEAGFGPTSRYCARPLRYLGEWHLERGAYAAASAQLTRAAQLEESAPGTPDLVYPAVLRVLGEALLREGKAAQALAAEEKALAVSQEKLGADSSGVGFSHLWMAAALQALGRAAEARAHADQAMAVLEKKPGPESSEYFYALVFFGRRNLAEGKAGDAARQLARAVELISRAEGDQSPLIAQALVPLGRARLAEGRLPEAEASLRRGLERAIGNQLAPDLVGEARFALARTLQQRAGAGPLPPEVRALALEASADFGRSEGTGRAAAIAEIEAWLRGPSSRGTVRTPPVSPSVGPSGP